MWWKDIVNRYAHGDPMPWHTGIIWRCEECGNPLFQVIVWDRWKEGATTINNRFALKCLECGRMEANMVVSVLMW